MSQEKMLKNAGLSEGETLLTEPSGFPAQVYLDEFAFQSPPDPRELIAAADARLGPAVGLRPTHTGGDKIWSPAQRQFFPIHPALKRR